MRWTSTMGVGAFYNGTERFGLITDRLTSPAWASSRPLVLIHHGANQNAHQAMFEGTYAGTTGLQVTQALVAAGFDVLAIDASSTQNWGNQASLDASNVALTWGTARGLRPSRSLLLLSYSMGGLPALNYHRRENDFPVKAWCGVIPAINLNDLYVRNALGASTFITDAYGGSENLFAIGAQYDPYQHLGTGPPSRLIYSEDDDVTRKQWVTDYAAATPDTDVVSLGNVGHSIQNLNPADITSFFEAHA